MSLNRTVRLADPEAKLPIPGAPGSLAPKGPFEVSVIDPFWAACLSDGSVLLAEPEPEPPVPPKPAKG